MTAPPDDGVHRTATALSALWDIATEASLDLDGQLRAILALGCRQLELSEGAVARVERERYEIVEAISADRAPTSGTVLDLRTTFCRETLRQGRPFGFHDATICEWSGDPAYAARPLAAYFGVPLRTGTSVYGTLSFSASRPRARPFDATDEVILILMARLIEAGLEQRRIEHELAAVASGTGSVFGEGSLHSLVRHLARALDVPYTFVTECTDPKRRRVRTLAFWSVDRFADNVEYDVGDTPCRGTLDDVLVYHPDDVQDAFPEDQTLAALGIRSYVGVPIRGASGSVVGHLAAMDVRPMPPRLGREWLLRVFASCAGAEIDRRIAEHDLAESERRYSLATAAARVGVWDWNIRTGEFFLDPNVKGLLGYSAGEIPNDLDAWSKHIHPDDRDAVMRGVSEHLAERTPEYVCEHRMIHRDGTVRWILSRGTTIRDADGTAVRMVGTDTDVTERKRAEDERRRFEAQVQQAQKLESLGLLAGGIAHDFNNLLMGVLGNASLVLGQLPPGSPIRERVEQIEKAALRAADLTQQLLTYSGRGRFVVVPIDLNDLVTEMTHLLRTVISKHATIDYDLARDLPAIEADATQLRQVIMNLITNASEALGPQGGTITLRTRASDPGQPPADAIPDLAAGRIVMLEVRDTGVGMDAETQKKIFDPFFTTKFTGRGLGLAAVLGIVRGHRGTIRVESRPGRGTRIRVLFPATTRAIRPVPREPRIESAWRGSGTLLVVDDEEVVRGFTLSVLEERGFEVVTAVDGLDGIECFRKSADRIRAVILDMTMPHMDGEDVLRRIHDVRPGVPVLLMSGYSEQDATRRFSPLKPAGFLHKPFRPADLLSKLREILENRDPEPP